MENIFVPSLTVSINHNYSQQEIVKGQSCPSLITDLRGGNWIVTIRSNEKNRTCIYIFPVDYTAEQIANLLIVNDRKIQIRFNGKSIFQQPDQPEKVFEDLVERIKPKENLTTEDFLHDASLQLQSLL